MAQPRKPSRILNERSVVMGLDFADLVGLAVVLLIFQVSLKPFHKEILALGLTLFASVILSSIRLKFRRRIIRDFIASKFGPKRF